MEGDRAAVCSLRSLEARGGPWTRARLGRGEVSLLGAVPHGEEPVRVGRMPGPGRA